MFLFFFLGDKHDVSYDIYTSFQKIGISHLFALSGTQISFLSIIFTFIFQKIFNFKEKSSFILTMIFLFLYYLLIDSCAAIDRALVFTFIFNINKIYDFFIPFGQLILLCLTILFFLYLYRFFLTVFCLACFLSKLFYLQLFLFRLLVRLLLLRAGES